MPLYYYVDQDIQNQIQNILDNRHSNTDFIDAIEKVVLPLLYEKRELLQVVFSENLHSTWISFIENRYSELLLPLFRDKVYEGTTIPAISQVKSVIHTFMGLVSIGVRQPVTQNMHDFSATILFALRNSVEALIEN
ncbi:hypothetical protein K1728_12075 (plasmid) [Weissella confusa]|uniref:hypothetical protein n=1 Tax=Weissella confusa TaxID=1583 RepID=UPI001C6FC278|nr:hypothetical protein [Weissella confusa]QYU59000.1 hypothetical protein K1728_12075 [Weissella confusa]